MGFFDDLFGGSSGDAAGDASSAYEEWAKKAIDEYKSSRSQALGYEEPYLQAGKEGLQSYLGTLGLGDRQGALDRFQASPGYKFAMQQGQQAIQRKGAATGLTGSGAESKELTKYGQGVANQEYGQYQSRLADLAGRGQQAAGASADITKGFAEDIGGAYQGIGQSSANSILAQYMADQKRRAGEWGAIGQIGGAMIGAAGKGGMGGGGF